MEEITLKVIAHIQNDFMEKFGVPHQSGLESSISKIVFEKEFSDPNSLLGLGEFSHIWLIWGFSENPGCDHFSPTVRPPRLGGNKREGVFATRSPNRPNPIGLSSVELVSIDKGCLLVRGADLVNGTPIYDIKPYLPTYDCHVEANGGFSTSTEKRTVEVNIPSELSCLLPTDKLPVLKGILSLDPRPAYQDDDRTYGLRFGSYNVKFFVKDKVLTVTEINGE